MGTLRERLLAMAKVYDEKWRFGGRNPLDNETRQLLEDAAAEIKELEEALEQSEISIDTYREGARHD